MTILYHMINPNSIPPELLPAYERAKALTDLIEKSRTAQLGEEPQMRKELQKVEKLAIKQLSELDDQIRSWWAKNKS